MLFDFIIAFSTLFFIPEIHSSTRACLLMMAPNFQGHTQSDPLPPIRPYLLKAPPPPDNVMRYESNRDYYVDRVSAILISSLLSSTRRW